MNRKRLNDVFSGWATGAGIFNALQDLDVPWKDDDMADVLDLEYHGNIAGDRLISPIIAKTMTGEILTSEEISRLANVIYKINATNWNKEWATLSAEYNPIENYSMTEMMTDDETVVEYGKTSTRTDNLSHTKTGTEQDAPDLENVSESDVHGFNSTDGVPTEKQTTTSTGTQTTTYNTTDADTGTVTDRETGSDTHTRNYSLTRSGNIGVTTSQQMLQSERDLWVWNYFINVVFPAINRVLTLSIY